jgi:translocation and assembly module TamB
VKRVVKWVFGGLALLVLLPLLAVVGGLIWVNTEGGRETLARLAASQVPGLTIEGLRGPLPGHPSVARVTMADADGVWLVLEEARIDLDLVALVQRSFRIRAIEAARVVVERAPAAGDTPPPEPTPPGETVLPQLPSLPVSVVLDRLAIARLELGEALLGQAAAVSLGGDARLEAGALHANLDLRRLDREGGANLAVALTPAEDRLSAKLTVQEAAGGLGPTLAGFPEQPLALDLTLEGPASGAALTLRGGLGPEIAITADGTVRARPDGALGATLRGEMRAAPLLPAEVAPLATPVTFSLDTDMAADRRVTLRALSLQLPVGTATASGTAALATEALDLRLVLDLAASSRFGALLPAGLAWQGMHAEASITGTIAQPAIDLTATPAGLATGVAQADAVLGPTPRLVLQASLPGPGIDLRVEGAEGLLTAKGSLAEPIALDAALSLPRLAVLGSGSEGALKARVQTSGTLTDPDLTVTATSGRIAVAGRVLEGLALDARIATPASTPRGTATLAGKLDGLPLALAFRGQPQGSQVRIEQGELRLGPATLTATGTLDPAGPVFDGEARLEASDLAPLGRLAGQPGLGGRLSLTAKLAPRDGMQGFDTRLDAPQLAYGATAGSLQATVAGTPVALDWSIQGRAPEGSVEGRGRVTQADGGWRVALAALEARAMEESLRLAAPTQVTLGTNGGVELAPLALQIGRGGQLRASGRWGPERADITANLTGLPLAIAERFAPDVKPRGSLTAELRATGPVAKPEIRLTVNGEGLGANADWAQGLPNLGLRAEATLSGTAATARAELSAGPAGTLTATARLPNGFDAASPLNASLDGSLNIAPLAQPFLAAGADRVAGRLAVALRAEGTVGAPRFGGRATLSGGDYRNTAFGVRLREITGTLTGDGTRLVIEQFRARTAGNGSITISGNVDAGAPGFPADITIAARNAQPVASELVTATIGADLRVTGPLTGGGRVAGEVRIQQAEIRVPQTLPASVPTLGNVQQRGRLPPGVLPPPRPVAAPSGPPAPPIDLAVTLVAPRAVYIRGRGIDVELGGNIDIGGTATAPVPNGSLTLRKGTLDVLARRLTFQRGNISFAAGTLMPQLDLAAQATARATTITVSVSGSPTAPEVTFSSSPELPQDEILARLLFDRATSNLSPFEIAQIAQALAQLTGIGGGGDSPLDKVRSALGLDRLGVTSGSGASAATVEAGRYVAPGVFLGVRQGTQGQTGVGVQVEITPNLKLEGQTATGPAGDRVGLSYEFEY